MSPNEVFAGDGIGVFVLDCLGREVAKEPRDFSVEKDGAGVLGEFWLRNSLSAVNQSSMSLPCSRPRLT